VSSGGVAAFNLLGFRRGSTGEQTFAQVGFGAVGERQREDPLVRLQGRYEIRGALREQFGLAAAGWSDHQEVRLRVWDAPMVVKRLS
jgi:hypothetical protein